ncbi:MAG: alkaline phosphatase [Flavobacteriaceae bacterium]|nr:alkaline phosphatase [Flavobacteriaceae bacterium]
MFRELTIIFILCSSINIFGQDSKPPNIIMMIGDGMGLSAISSGMYSNNNYTSLERSEYIGLLKTHSLDNLVTDSAASGTAMSSGVKTYNRTVGLDGNLSSVKSILEICRDRGYTTAIVATSTIVHATPASYYSKVKSRYQYDEIASQLSKSNINFFVGGGEKYFNDRVDGRNLINEMDDYFFANSLESFKNINSNKIGYLTYYDEPVGKHEGREPSLEDIAQITIQKLKSFDNPFFLLVEGSQIDWGGHDNDSEHLISEMLEFDKTIETVFNFADKDKNTLVVITADHETGGAAIVDGNLEESFVKIKYVSGDHTATMVPIFSLGPYSSLFKGVYDNTEIFDKLEGIIKK